MVNDVTKYMESNHYKMEKFWHDCLTTKFLSYHSAASHFEPAHLTSFFHCVSSSTHSSTTVYSTACSTVSTTLSNSTSGMLSASPKSNFLFAFSTAELFLSAGFLVRAFFEVSFTKYSANYPVASLFPCCRRSCPSWSYPYRSMLSLLPSPFFYNRKFAFSFSHWSTFMSFEIFLYRISPLHCILQRTLCFPSRLHEFCNSFPSTAKLPR